MAKRNDLFDESELRGRPKKEPQAARLSANIHELSEQLASATVEYLRIVIRAFTGEKSRATRKDALIIELASLLDCPRSVSLRIVLLFPARPPACENRIRHIS